MTEWISCKEQLPPKGMAVLAFDGDFIYIDTYLQNSWLMAGTYPNVTHWMPLPDPPKESDTE